MNALLYHPTFQMEMKGGEKKGKILYQDLEMICVFLGVLLQGKRLEGAPFSVGTASEIFEGINLYRTGKNPK